MEEEAEQRQEDGLPENEAPLAARRELCSLALKEGGHPRGRAGRDWSNTHAMPVTDCARSAGIRGSQPPQSQHWRWVGITAMFSAFDTILIRPLPYNDADRLVMIWRDMRNANRSGFMPNPAESLEWRRHNTVFTDTAATQPGGCDTLWRFRTRACPGAQNDGEYLGRYGCKAADREGVYRRRRSERRPGSRNQPPAVAAALWWLP
jgi:hypothetical protein